MYDRICALLRPTISPRLLRHSEAVAAAAARLAPAFGSEEDAARLAGLLHDGAKELGAPEALALAGQAGLDLCDAERRSPAVLHQRLGALWARERFGVRDPALLAAIACHTTGRAEMDGLARCLFVADWIAADRVYPGVKALRATAARDAEAAFLDVLQLKREHFSRQGHPEHPWATEACARWLGSAGY